MKIEAQCLASRLATVLLCLAPILAAVFAWWYPYYYHWRTISEEEAANIAQKLAANFVRKLRADEDRHVISEDNWHDRLRWYLAQPEAEDRGVTSVTNWLLIQTNARPLDWRVTFRVGNGQSDKLVDVIVTNGPSGWGARLK